MDSESIHDDRGCLVRVPYHHKNGLAYVTFDPWGDFDRIDEIDGNAYLYRRGQDSPYLLAISATHFLEGVDKLRIRSVILEPVL